MTAGVPCHSPAPVSLLLFAKSLPCSGRQSLSPMGARSTWLLPHFQHFPRCPICVSMPVSPETCAATLGRSRGPALHFYFRGEPAKPAQLSAPQEPGRPRPVRFLHGRGLRDHGLSTPRGLSLPLLLLRPESQAKDLPRGGGRGGTAPGLCRPPKVLFIAVSRSWRHQSRAPI